MEHNYDMKKPENKSNEETWKIMENNYDMKKPENKSWENLKNHPKKK